MGNTISINSWEDVIFEDRNKDYGAYRLSYSYPCYLSFSALIVIALFISVMVLHQLLRENQIQVLDINPGKFIHVPVTLIPSPPIDKPLVPKNKISATSVEDWRLVRPQVTTDDIEENKEMQTNREIEEAYNTSYAEFTRAGIAADGSPAQMVAPIELKEDPAATPAPGRTEIAKSPEFPGGDKALVKWLGSHLNYPAMAQRMGIEGQVVVEFTVGMDGRVADVKVVKSLHKLCDQEAIRLVKSMPPWTPGESNGVRVVARRTLPIRFVLQ
jgi:protein TonB